MTKNDKLSQFQLLLQAQIGHEFNASQQYIAVAVYYDREDLPQLAQYFYKQAIEERNHAMMIVQYFLDHDLPFTIPGVEKITTDFKDYQEPLHLAYQQEIKVTDQFVELARVAREENEYIGEQFLQWFLKEQVEEVSTMRTLLAIAERTIGNSFDLENFIARDLQRGTKSDDAPKAAGGNL